MELRCSMTVAISLVKICLLPLLVNNVNGTDNVCEKDSSLHYKDMEITFTVVLNMMDQDNDYKFCMAASPCLQSVNCLYAISTASCVLQENVNYLQVK